MAGPGSRRPYPVGPKREMTAPWKALVRARLAELGKPDSWLEQRLGRGKGTISRMFSEGNTSSLVVPICEILAIPEPFAEMRSAAEYEMLVKFRRMSDAEQAHLLGLLKLTDPKSGD